MIKWLAQLTINIYFQRKLGRRSQVPQIPAEQLAKKVEAELKRLAPQAVMRCDYSNYQDDGVDLYVYAPRKIADIMRGKLKAVMDAELRRVKDLRARLLMEDMENMSAEAKQKYGIQA
jgi:hypothetical protein